MGRIKTKYRAARYADGGAVHQPVEIDTPKATIVVEKVDDDDPSKAFQGQIDALRRAEEHQRNAQQAPQQPQLTERQWAFVHANPEMMKDENRDRLYQAMLAAHV